MKVIAKRNIYNNFKLKIDPKDTPHPKQVPKGYVWEIGPPEATTLDALKNSDAQAFMLAAELFHDHAISSANDTVAVERIHAEIAETKKREENWKKMDKQSHLSMLGEQMAEMLSMLKEAKA